MAGAYREAANAFAAAGLWRAAFSAARLAGFAEPEIARMALVLAGLNHHLSV